MLVELAIGDAYGKAFEYNDDNLYLNDLLSYVSRSGKRIHRGKYTDDTQMSIAIAELIIESPGKTPSRLTIANKFVETYKRDPIQGYSRRFQTLLDDVKSGAEFLERINPVSDRSGSAMRATPLGILKDKTLLLEFCTEQAILTHNTTDGILAAQAASLMTHYFIHTQGKPADLPDYIANNVEPGSDYKWNEPYRSNVGSQGHNSVRAAITAIARNDNLGACLLDCINFTGDVDTVAAIAMSAASCSKDYTKNLPKFLFDNLQNDFYGRDYLQKLDKQLMEIR